MRNNLKVNPLANAIRISGSKGGDTARKSVESPDSLFSIAQARIIDLISEGEIEGFVHGADFLRDVYFDETPTQNADGTRNFKNFQVDARTGTQDQTYIPGFPAVENELGVGVPLLYGTPWTRSFTNKQLSAVRVRLGVNALSKTDATSGDVMGYSVAYAIDVATDGGAFVEVCQSAMSGKASAAYERGHRIELPTSTVSGWIIRVRRLTPESTTQYIIDGTSVISVTEIIDGKFRYPMSALVGVQIDASQFSSIPTRAYHVKGRKIKVPANYDPVTRTYATSGTGTSGGSWNGTFKTAYSNNPAWVFYDMTTHKRYGLGRLVDELLIDKWALYNIAQYCDEIVPDGFGGTEPRMTCNLYLQSAADAWKVIGDLSSIFRGICYWAGGSIVPVADRPSDPVYTYTNANVVDGTFRYESSSRRARHTAVIVSYNDMTDFGRLKSDYYDDPEGIARFGFQLAEIVALGCTSRGQAQRFAKWLLYSEKLLTNTVSFSVGVDGTFALPGQIVRVADQWRAGRRIGGRIASATASQIVVDALPSPAPMVGDTAIVTLPSGVTESRTVSSVVGKGINVSVPWSAIPVSESVWAVESTDLSTQLFRILGCKESEEDGSYSILAMQHNASIFDAVDFGEAITVPPISVVPSPNQQRPASVDITSVERAGEVIAMSLLMASWTPATGAVKYQIQWRKDKGEWTTPQTVNGTTADYQTPFPGVYEAKVVAINAIGVISVPQYSTEYTLIDQSLTPGFVEELNADIAEALLTAENAQATADGSIVSFWQDTAPAIGAGAGEAKVGDIWFDTNDGNHIWRVVGGVWVDAQDDELAQALAAASTAQSTADGKVKTWFGTVAPTSPDVTAIKGIGDLWFNTTLKKLYRWNGADWSAEIADVTLDQIGGSGVNLIPEEYTRRINLDTGVFARSGATPATVIDSTPSTYAFRFETVGATSTSDWAYFSDDANNKNITVQQGKYLLSYYARSTVVGHEIQARLISDLGTTIPGTQRALSASYQRFTEVIEFPSATVVSANLIFYFNRSGVAGRQVFIDRVMLEPMVGRLAQASAWAPGTSSQMSYKAIAAAAFAQDTADGKIDSFFQATMPATGSLGDLWFDTDDGNKQWRHNGTIWVEVQDTAIGDAILAAAGAQSTADGKVKTFYQNSTPIAEGVGDLWYNTDTKLLSRWSGSAWIGTVQVSLGDSPTITNGDFSRSLQGWTVTLSAPSWSVTDDAGPALNNVVGAASADIIQDLYIPVKESQRYKLSLMLERAGATPDGTIGFAIRKYDNAKAQISYASLPLWSNTDVTTYNPVKFERIYTVEANVAYIRVGLIARSRTTGGYLIRNVNIERLPDTIEDLPFGPTYGYPATTDLYLGGGYWRIGLRYPGSGHRIGDQRNLPQSIVNAYGSVRTTGALSATSGGAVSVLAHTIRMGGSSISYSAVPNAVTGLTQNVTYTIYCLDDAYVGGVRTWFASSASIDQVMNLGDGIVIAGAIKIPASGSSTGGGGAPGPGECVDYYSVLPDGRMVRDLQVGDLVPCVDVTRPDPQIEMVPLVAIEVAHEDCYRLTSSGLVSVIQSKSTPMNMPDGRVLRTTEMFGQPILVNRDGVLSWDIVADLEFVGYRKVLKVNLGDRMFFAGESPRGTIATHNIIWKP